MSGIIHFNLFEMNCVGHVTHGLWQHSDNNRHRYTDLNFWLDLARLLERGLFDTVFLADVIGVYERWEDGYATALREGFQVPANDPLLLIPAMAAVTDHLGFAVTFSTTYEPPFAFARRMSTLDHLTKGRVGWNVVTSYLKNAALNFGLDAEVEHDDRYDIADEYLEVLYKLWEGSWADDAVRRDRDRLVYTDPAKVQLINHVGKNFRVVGPHLSEPSPQRTPVIFQAGSSDRGRMFAARHAEGVFVGGTNPEVVARNVADIKAQAEALGREPAHLVTFASASIIVGRTQREVDAKVADFREHIAAYTARTRPLGSGALHDYPPQTLIADLVARGVELPRTATRYLWAGKTVRDAVQESSGFGHGAFFVAGTPEQVADAIEEWVEQTGLDGFNLRQFLTPGTAEDFIDLIVPELQRRGRYRTSYDDSTLRERLLGKGTHRLPHDHFGARYRYSEGVTV